MSKIFVWANSDLDGVCSTILLGNIFPDMEYKSVFFGDFLNQYTDWETELENYDKVFVVGMVLDQSLVNKIDDQKVVFVSDRGEKLNVFDSSIISEETSSCCKLLYKKFKEKFDIPNDLKKLILYIDDYNTYTLNYKESEYLNGLYRNTRFNRFKVFVNRFWNGYDGLTDKEMKLAEDYFKAIDDEYVDLELYAGDFKGWTVISAFSTKPVNEIAKKLLDNHDKDVSIIINPQTQFVSFRKRENSPADIVFMAEKLCGGGGSEFASGGGLEKKFLDFTSTLFPYKV